MTLNKEKVRAVIFDMDGVLFLSGDCHELAWRETLQSIGIVDFSYADIAGMRTDDALLKVLTENGKEKDVYDIPGLVAKKRLRAFQLLETEGKVAPDSVALVNSLRKKYRLALASSASSKTVALFFKQERLCRCFRSSVGRFFRRACEAGPRYL